MAHLAYARKYRPKDFDELIDQEHIATTLTNAIEQDNLAHAYLFSGSRGIGKTSTARILAKALNCKKGPTAKPCNVCDSCLAIAKGSSLDVLEIDGASNRGIDEIRTLRENVKFAPSSSRFKIYIIDEVHMLTTEAFNALLKTLEEPPAHVKFIFATTEPHKVLPTILSRCQRFDFRKITTAGIIVKLKKLIAEEKIQCAEDALYAIAKSSDGSLRDAEVILDQLNSFSIGQITLDSVNAVLGLVSKDAIFKVVDQMSAAYLADNIALIDELLESGKDAAQLISSFIDHFRDMMMLKCDNEKLVTLPQEDKQKLKQQSIKFELDNILYCLTVLLQAQERMKRQGMVRLFLEMALIKISRQDGLLPANKLLKKLNDLELKLGNSQKNVSSDAAAKSPVNHKAVAAKAYFNKSATDAVSYEKPAIFPKKANDIRSSPPSINPSSIDHPGGFGNSAASLSLDVVCKAWPQIIKNVKKQKITLGVYLAEGRPVNIHNNKVEVGFPDACEFHRENLIESQNLKIIEQAASEFLDREVRLDLIRQERVAQEVLVENNDVEVDLDEGFGLIDPDEENESSMDDVIQSAIDVFKGRIVTPD
ncbi:MAG: DNA polymerase III subunit gamma/tau [Candidatus Omnitrophica bacterium]|nr:DNA polymerase III subunit gamma/tau [Candidatus Omnitrophota bacterium]